MLNPGARIMNRIRRVTRACCLAIAVLSPCTKGITQQTRGDSGSFAIISPLGDTVAVERFVRWPDSLKSELMLRAGGIRTSYLAITAPDASVPRLDLAVRRLDAAPESTPLQHVILSFSGD